MRVVITTGIFPPDIGGPATYVPVLAGALVSRGCRVSVVTLSETTDAHPDTFSFPVVRIHRRIPLPFRIPRLVLSLLRRGARADLFLCAGLPIETAVAAACLRKPMVMKVVGDRAWERARAAGLLRDDLEVFQRRRYGQSVEMHRALERWAVRRAVRVIAPSEYLRRIVIGWAIPPRTVAVIPNAIPDPASLEMGTNASGTLSGWSGDGIRAITIARLVPWKGVDRLIEGIAQMEQAELTVVGDGPERGRLEALARHLTAPVHFMGAVPRLKALSLLRAADVLILNSTYEGLPHVVLEAMALRVPVVAAASSGTRELVRDGETGLLMPQGTPTELVDALERLHRNRALRTRLIETAWTLARQFTPEAMVDRTWSLLQECLPGRP